MARLRNLSASFLKPFQSPDSPHSRSASQPLTLQTNDQSREKPYPSPTIDSTTPTPTQATPSGVTTRERSGSSRPQSMVYPASLQDMGRQDVEELLPVFSFLSSHSNKLYQEGYFLKLNDLDTNGRPNTDRNWTECFAQLVGTVLSLWDAAALDAAGQDGEVAPTFINLADASIKMIETLPTRNQDVQPLQNVLSISTAGKNRYLLHFNSLHSLTQWTSGIRLAMFEHASLHELYTGSLIAGKGKYLNNIRAIMEKSKLRTEDWARVRFGAGTPWRRCWCVIEPPDEKEILKAQKTLKKSRSPYDRPSYPKGDIKFFDTKKTKKALPIATITDAYSAYAIYPQSKPLIDQSTLVKVEGRITIHSKPESKTEGFVFVMPEVHPAVSGFEMMLRWLFPVYDTFRLYGRPDRLIADTQATQGLMFAMPKERRYGYLDIIDVSTLIHTEGSEQWSEREWRKRMKDATQKRMEMVSHGRTSMNMGRGPSERVGSRNGVRYDDAASVYSSPGRHQHNQSSDAVFSPPKKVGTAPPSGPYPLPAHNYHARALSESVAIQSPTKGKRPNEGYVPSRLSTDQQTVPQKYVEPVEMPSAPPRRRDQYWAERQNQIDSPNSSDSELVRQPEIRAEDVNRDMMESRPPAPVAAPPPLTHQPGDRPNVRPNVMPDLRREKSRMSTTTLSQLVDASKNSSQSRVASAGAAAAWKSREPSRNREDQGPRGVGETPNDRGMPANQVPQGMVADGQYTESPIVTSVAERPRQASAHSINRKPVPRTSSDYSVPRQTISRTASEHSVNRKPLPTAGPPVPQIPRSESIPGLASDASLLAAPVTHRQIPDSASQYSTSPYDREEDSEPDYSSRKSTESKKSAKIKPRTGVVKTVGDPELGNDVPPIPTNTGIPDINFGPTQSLPVSRPGTSMSRRSPIDNRAPFGDQKPNEEKRLSHMGRTSPSTGPDKSLSYTGRGSPAPGLQSRSSSYKDRVAWQPGSGRQSPGPSLSPEDFVLQRSAAAMVPNGFVPSRNQTTHTAITVERNRESVVRQQSRSASPTVQNYSSNLSAQEQEHVARMTGSPLVSILPRQSPDPSVGLVGAIAAREQERRNMKEGVSGQMVQHAIAARQAQSQVHMAAQNPYNQQHAGRQQEMSYNRPDRQQQQQQPDYSYPQQHQQIQPGYNYIQHQQQQIQSGYDHPQQQHQQQYRDVRWNGQWVDPQAQAHWHGVPQQLTHQGQQQYHQQRYNGYNAPPQ